MTIIFKYQLLLHYFWVCDFFDYEGKLEKVMVKFSVEKVSDRKCSKIEILLLRVEYVK